MAVPQRVSPLLDRSGMRQPNRSYSPLFSQKGNVVSTNRRIAGGGNSACDDLPMYSPCESAASRFTAWFCRTPLILGAAFHCVVAGGGDHCETGTHCSPPSRSFLTNVMDPFTVIEVAPIKSIFPPAANVTGPAKVNRVTVSPGP